MTPPAHDEIARWVEKYLNAVLVWGVSAAGAGARRWYGRNGEASLGGLADAGGVG